jgi:serine beta-lactamase-like protein LACTB, mitochondrial
VPQHRIETWLTLLVLVAGLLLAGLGGLWVYMSATATPLHPDAQNVPSAMQSAMSAQWVDAVEQARQIARTAVADQNLPGLSVAVGVGGDIVWAEGFGWANLENRVKVAPDTRFRIGTTSTVLTSAAVGLLLERGRLKLDEKIQTYVPEFSEKEWPITLRQLMAHVAGVVNDGGDEGPLLSQHCDRPVDALQHFSGNELRLLFAPGTQFHYSSYGWIVVSAAIEAAANEPFLTFMQKHVFKPLRMDDTTPDSATSPIQQRATPYFPRFAADPNYGPDLMRDIDYSCYAGSSAFLSTPSDLVRLGMAVNSGTLLLPATVQLLQRSQRLASGQETGYGLGWQIETVGLSGQPTRAVGHDGTSLGGMVASLRTFPERGIVLAVLSNTSYAETSDIAVKIAQAFAEGASHPAPQ